MKRTVRITFAAGLLLCLVAACATLAPGADPVVVRTEQALQMSPAIYDAAISWAETNKGTLPPATLAAFEKVRAGFPPLYRSTDAALQLYKAGKANDLPAQSAELQKLIDNLIYLVSSLGGPNLGGGK